MTQHPLHNHSAKPTALPPETVRRQSFNASAGNRKSAIVFIDGSNWYHKLRKLLGRRPPIDFNLRKFCEELVSPYPLVDIRYYVGGVRRMHADAASEKLFADQQKLLHFLRRQSIHVKLGHLIQYPDHSFHEKGVDVRIAVEMIRLAVEQQYDVGFLLSSDTDLVPAAEECIKLGKEVVYVGSSLHGQSFGLTRACTRTILLQSKDIIPHIPPRPTTP